MKLLSKVLMTMVLAGGFLGLSNQVSASQANTTTVSQNALGIVSDFCKNMKADDIKSIAYDIGKKVKDGIKATEYQTKNVAINYMARHLDIFRRHVGLSE